jgi:hypothetical protein
MTATEIAAEPFSWATEGETVTGGGSPVLIVFEATRAPPTSLGCGA